MQLYSQPWVSTKHEIIVVYNFNDTAPIALDGFNCLTGGSTEFSGLATIYTLFKFVSWNAELVPFFPYSATLSDQCRGVACFAHGIYNTTTLPVANILRMPGSWDYNNKQRFSKTTYYEAHPWIPMNGFTDSATAIIPHCQFQANHYTLATTNTQLSMLKFRFIIEVTGRIV